MATIEKRNGKYRAKVRVKGQPTASATFPQKAQADRWAQETYVKMINGRYFGLSYTKTFAELVEEYQRRRQSLVQSEATINVAQSVLQYFLDVFGGKLLNDIKAADITEQVDQLVYAEKKYSTINRYINTLSGVFQYAVEKEWLETNPCTRVRRFKVKSDRGVVLTKAQENALFTALTEYDVTTRRTARFALLTGARLSEVTQLSREDISADGRTVTFRNTKNGDDRTIPISGRVAHLLSLNEANYPFNGFKRSAWEKAVDEAGLAGFRFHDLRHTFITRAIAAGKSPAHVAAYVGHKSLTMTAKYTHLTAENIRSIVE